MTDDIIHVRLQIDQSTVANVENQVANIIRRLNQQRVNITFNASTINNCIAQLERLENTVTRLQNSQINVNAQLTSEQQTYRLQTERIRTLTEQRRVAQQITVERERTLQTENRAVQALATENRTLTVNRNLTADINGNVAHTHQHIRNAENATNNFTTSLGRSLQQILQYRVISEMLNQITAAYQELQNVDSSMVGYRKVTGATKEEAESITKEAFAKATEYGRLASEYAESTERFAKAGYYYNSSELSKLSMLAMNVGDIDNELANEFLVAADAAWKLNGDVSELSKILDMFNELSNRTATDVGKLSAGITVSGSMFAQAGLSAQDYAAIIGTATSKTQRSGEEMSRAWRTIIMNLSQIRGTDIETGEIIDEEKLAKAEKMLNSVGIQIREVVNGQSELRNPMNILAEIASKWQDLSSIQQSALAESISGKRQSNAFISVVENWKDVEKAIAITAESSGSALKENAIYLDSWNAKSKQLSAEWAEFISHITNVEAIKSVLDALSTAVDMIDTPIGRGVTQIVLLNAALASSRRLWQGIRAHSIVADILSVGAAERNLGGAIQLVSGHLAEQALAFARSPFGMATIAVTGITLITSAIEKHSQKLEENAQKTEEALSKVKSEMEELDGLINKYNELQLSGEWDNTSVEDKKQLQEDINKLLGDEADKIDIINGKYKETTEELFRQRMAKIPEEERAASDNSSAKGTTLWDTVYWNNDRVVQGKYLDMPEEQRDIYNKYSHVFTPVEKIQFSNETMDTIHFDNFGDFMYKYEEIQQMLQEMYDNGMSDSELYKYLSEFISRFETKVTEYKAAVKELENTQAGRKISDYITQNVGGYIDNLEEYNKAVEWIEQNFTGEDKANALGFLNTYFSQYAQQTEEGTNAVTTSINEVVKSLSTLQSKYDELKSAQDEYNSTGVISAETMQKLIDNDLLQYLDYSSGKLKINTDALLAEGEAAKVNAIQKLQDAMATDLMNLATGKTDQLSSTAQTAIANLGNSAETTGNQAETAAGKLAGFAIAAQAAKDGAEGKLSGMSVEDFNLQADAIISAYTNAANSIGSITIKSPKTSSSKKSSDKNEALDNYLDNAERRYKIHEDETRYINDLTYALRNLVKTDEERLDVLDKIEQARKDYVENQISDIEHEIELRKSLYGEDSNTFDLLLKKQKLYHAEAERYRKFMRDLGYDDATIENTSYIQEMQSGWWDTQDEIIDLQKTIADTKISDIEHQIMLGENNYGSNYNPTALHQQIQDIAHAEAEALRAIDPERYKEQIQEWQKVWWDAEESMLDYRWNLSQTWIDKRNDLGDWAAFDDNEVKAWQRVINWLKTEYPHALDKIAEAEENLRNAQKDEFGKATDFGSSYLNSRKTLLQSHFDMTNAIAEAQHEINKELENSLTLYEYLDEETRKLLFNQDDYNALSAELLKIENQAYNLQARYENELLNATADTLDEITSKYEMQYETLMKSYEIAKADLEIAKKKAQLNNVLAERNVRQLVKQGDKFVWEWVADSEAVANAKSELADAEYARRTAEAGRTQTESINKLTAQQDALGTVINQFESGVITLDEAVLAAASAIGQLPTIIEQSFGTVSTSFGGTTESTPPSGSTSNAVNRWATTPDGKNIRIQIENGETITPGLPVGTVIHTDGGDYEITGGDSGSYTSKKIDNIKWYARGDRRTQSGLAVIGEDEPETYIDSNGHLIPVNNPILSKIQSGGIVFNQDQMTNLRSLWDLSNLGKSSINSSLLGATNRNVSETKQYNIGDINITNPHDFNEFVQELTRAFKRRTV